MGEVLATHLQPFVDDINLLHPQRPLRTDLITQWRHQQAFNCDQDLFP